MRLKRFDQLNEGKFDDFIKDVKRIVNYDSDEFEQGDEPSNSDLLSEVGDLMNKYNLSTDDLQQIVDENSDDWDIKMYVAPQLDFELKDNDSKDETFNDIKNIFINNNLSSPSDKIDKTISDIIKYFNRKQY